MKVKTSSPESFASPEEAARAMSRAHICGKFPLRWYLYRTAKGFTVAQHEKRNNHATRKVIDKEIPMGFFRDIAGSLPPEVAAEFRKAIDEHNALTNEPTVVALHVDHIKPQAIGGNDDPCNLLTSCRECNIGKSDLEFSDGFGEMWILSNNLSIEIETKWNERSMLVCALIELQGHGANWSEPLTAAVNFLMGHDDSNPEIPKMIEIISVCRWYIKMIEDGKCKVVNGRPVVIK